MASNQIRYVGNMRIPGLSPLRRPGSFLAGASVPVKQGEFILLGSGTWAPLAADASMSGTIAISDCEIRSGDLAGYHEIIVPDEDDLFVVPLASASNPSIGAAVYYSTSQAVALTGSNILGYVVDASHYPMQGFQSVAPSYDAGTTIPNVTQVVIAIKKSVSYRAAIAA